MPDSTACLTARASLEEIRSHKQEFDVAYDLVVSSRKPEDVLKAQGLKRDLETKMNALQETLYVVEAERLFDLRHQYESQIVLLKSAGLVETKKETDAAGVEREVFFMTGIDGKEYPMPSYETIVSRFGERRELFETKADQGFKKLVLVPFGIGLDALIQKFRAHLLAYKKAHPAFGRIDPSLRDGSDHSNWDPLWISDWYREAGINNTLVYDPVSFD
ncbi:hypothetical protein EPN81_00745 [Patescibacteria group bacterium]|nr:MAG: hypothetical protein EPN81_00745 [Patescibacteria group bacterium]